MVKVKRALISVSDKKGIKEFALTLHRLGVEILSTGGTAKLLKEAGIPVKPVSDYTGFPEMLDGRVKTLHPRIHGALLALRENSEHMKQIKQARIDPIDMVVVNLYPFEKTVAGNDVELEEAIENIDIGGPSMLRSGAKNFKNVAVVSSPDSYQAVLKELQEDDCTLSDKTLKNLGVEVFKLTSHYDGAIYDYLKRTENPEGQTYGAAREQRTEGFPKSLDLSFEKVQDLRYGENPHQKAAFYKEEDPVQPGVVGAEQLHGKELSFNNIIDLNAALEIIKEFEKPAAAIIKHTNSCGAAVADSLAGAYKKALECDPLSAFGSIIGLNRNVDAFTAANIISAGFVEAIIAPGYDADALDQLKKKKNLRILKVGSISLDASRKLVDFKKVVGGLLVQDYNQKDVLKQELRTVTKKLPNDNEADSLIFAWRICKHVKSNAIVLVKDFYTVGIGAGQMSRVDSVIIACRKAGERTKGSVLASDAFFPKRDAIETAAQAGIKSIIQPGGSIRDQEIIDACNECGISMVFTGTRHFKH
ncbi:MAG: bifunctional phosphoribosylaminoimidazolecarboxamide formyltransferase/IMP cyclohydrolase [Candidatus Omnitrophota bacterium]|nr:bifunctional phosphoribosylaminoimidazolecarboxamide formyltransferase/IMP cyclohydrolase [Candidatus Omnitrophota bacterium]